MAKTKKKATTGYLARYDMFKYPAYEAFNLGGGHGGQSTLLGGCVSILLAVAMALFVVYKFTFVYGSDKDFVRTDEVLLSENFQSVQAKSLLADGDAKIFLQLRGLTEIPADDGAYQAAPRELDLDEVEKFITVY